MNQYPLPAAKKIISNYIVHTGKLQNKILQKIYGKKMNFFLTVLILRYHAEVSCKEIYKTEISLKDFSSIVHSC